MACSRNSNEPRARWTEWHSIAGAGLAGFTVGRCRGVIFDGSEPSKKRANLELH